MSSQFFALGLGIGTQNTEGEWLEVFYSNPIINPEKAVIDAILESTS